MEVSGQLHAPTVLAPGEGTPGTHWIGGWVGSTSGLDAVEKNPVPPRNRTSAAQSAHRRYTDSISCSFTYV
jgi:hypothetical protein